MKEKSRIIANKDRNLSIQNPKKRNPFHSDQIVDSENIERIRKFLMKRLPNDPVIEKAANIKPDKPAKPAKPANSDKKHGSHSLSELYFFQNHHK